MSDSFTTAKLVGGIGNQLFGYFAGYELAQKTSSQLRLDVTDIRLNRNVHRVSIETLNLPGEYYSKHQNIFSFGYLLERLIRKMSLINPTINNVASKFLKEFNSTEVGYDSRVTSLTKGYRLQGYFQTWRHFYNCSPQTIREMILLKEQSNWYTENLLEVLANESIAIHVRRGDYITLADSYGLLASDYYLKGLEKLSALGKAGRVWVFSDDIASAQQMLREHLPRNTKWVDPPIGTNPIESLSLMSKTNSLVIANSTFSWWAAALNNHQDSIIRPSKWFKALPDPLDLFPEEWHQIESCWIS